MTFNRAFANSWVLGVIILVGACARSSSKGAASKSGSGTSSSLPNGSTLPALSGPNVMPFTVNGSSCSSNSYPNKPCVSVTVCTPGTSNCVTIDDILLDTGSYGLRLFSSTITVPLTQSMSGSQLVAECVQYGDGSSDWGPVKTASVTLGGEPAVQVPIQVIDSTFAHASSYCAGADQDPSSTGFNGILGVGLFREDCGAGCATQANNHIYYGCAGSSSSSTCTGITMSAANQVTNPVAALPVDNNGVIVELPSVALGGIASANGYLVLGIGTASNNTPSNVTAYTADSSTGDFSTSFNGQSYSSFIDSGSNGIFLVAPSNAPDCSSTDPSAAGWLCPSSTLNLSATNVSSAGSPNNQVSFEIGNVVDLWKSPNNVFVEMAGGVTGSFDWGLPFYFGRNVYLGIAGTTSSLGSGPYWAY